MRLQLQLPCNIDFVDNPILRWVEAFRTTGSGIKSKSFGLHRTVRTAGNIKQWEDRSLIVLNGSRRSLQGNLHEDLLLQPNQLIVLRRGNSAQRREICARLWANFTVDPDTVIMMRDQAHFHLTGYVKKQNWRYWAAENPRELNWRLPPSDKLTGWCGISVLNVVGIYFLKEQERVITVTLTASRCHSSHSANINRICSTIVSSIQDDWIVG